jgi:hypothetical protein
MCSIDDLEKIVDLIDMLSSPKLDEEVYKHLLEVLARFAKRSDLSEKDQGHLAALLYEFSFSTKEQDTRQMFLEIIHKPDLSAEQLISIAEISSYYLFRESEEGNYIYQKLVSLAQDPQASMKQMIQVIDVLYKFIPSAPERLQEVQPICLHMIQNPLLPPAQIIQVAHILYQHSRSGSKERQQAAQRMRRVAGDEELTIEQRLSAITPFLEIANADYSDKAFAVSTMQQLLPEDEEKAFLKDHWRFGREDREPKDVRYMIELVGQDLLPEAARNMIYELLEMGIPEFDKIDIFEE